jgi:hypothetical protein
MFIRKLRSPGINFEHIIAIITVSLFIIFLIIFGFRKAYGIFALIGLFYTIVNTILYFKTRNSGYLANTFLFLCIIFFSLFIFIYGLEQKKTLITTVAVLTIIAGIWVIVNLFSRKLKWRTREVLELAAMPVTETEDGFTNRPLVAGRINFTEREIRAFSMFMRKNLIATPYEEEDKIIFSIDVPFWELVWKKRDWTSDTKVIFHYDGNVTVNIAKNEYLKYKERLSFDQLCDSLGKLFIEFLDLYVKGEGIRVIDRFNALKLNPFIE